MIDLHMHTTRSDGQYSPSELVSKAASKGISVMAITDHDTIEGLEEGKNAAEKAGIIFVPGIEITIDRPSCEFHLLGLGIENPSKSLFELIQKAQQNRKNRNQKIVENLNGIGFNVTLEEIQEAFPGQTLCRPHFASWMEEHKVVKHRQEAFDKYLARGKPWFSEHKGSNLDDAIMAIYESKGIPVHAHPLSLYLSWTRMDETFKNLKERGVAGIEAFHPSARQTECLRLEEIARKYNFFVTAGSDFHGEKIRRDRKPGHTAGDKKIDDKYYYEELLPALEKSREEKGF